MGAMQNPGRFILWLGRIHAVYYVVTGLWPIVHMPSFLMVTGPKTDLWLVQTVGAFIAVTGFLIARAVLTRRFTRDLAWLAIGQAFVLLLVDVIFPLRGTISFIYLAEAPVELALLIAWLFALRQLPGDRGN
jgi:hypothetical protein